MSDGDLEDFALVVELKEAVEDQNKRKRKATLLYVLQGHEYDAYHSLVQELAEQVSHIVTVHMRVYMCVCVCARAPMCLCAFFLWSLTKCGNSKQ